MKKYLIALLVLVGSFHLSAEEGLFTKGLESLTKKEYSLAEQYFTQDIELEPSFSSFYNLGITYGEQEKWVEAKWAFESALKYKPANSEAQKNARFVNSQISNSHHWDHPYSWSQRLIIGIGFYPWFLLVILSSIGLGVVLFFVLSKHKRYYRQGIQLIVPFALLFIFSAYSLFKFVHHFDILQYGIVKKEQTQLYISPEGVQWDQEIPAGKRLQILQITPDKNWIQLEDEHIGVFWVSETDVYIY